ncbi:MAG: hypothetical protein DGJ47_000042 [Rickettsiaceae bacterium]
MKKQLPKRSLAIKYWLDRIIEEILAVQKDKIAKIILFGSYAKGNWVVDKYTEGHITYTYESDLDLLIILKKGKHKANAHSIDYKIRQRLERKNLISNPRVTLVLESINFVNKKLEESQYFFADIKKEGVLLYDSGEYELSEPKNLTEQEKRIIAKKDYDQWFKRGSGFLEVTKFCLFQQNELHIAAFELHQSTESFYNALLLVLTGYKPKIHDIETLSGMVKSYDNDLLKIFPRDTEERDLCFILLKAAYIDARYDANYHITKEQLEYLLSRVEMLKTVTEKICLPRI